MSSVFVRARGLWLAAAAASLCPVPLAAQTTSQELPTIVVQSPHSRASARRATRTQPSPPAAPAATSALPQVMITGDRDPGVRGALAVLSAQEALREIQRAPGGVALVPANAYRNSTVASTIKDILDYVPGVFAQPKWGEDTRLSIRGSSLSRNFHLRGIQLYMDGIPINNSDGYGEFQEIDPTAYDYVEVYKGANALRFGANSLGGAINFVSRSGRGAYPNGVSFDAGAFGFARLQANAGGVNGPWDGFVTASRQQASGFRDNSAGFSTRLNGNVGYLFSPDAETRFYVNANSIRQHIPGSVTRETALTSPRTAADANVANVWKRDIDSVRFANKTTLRFDDTKFEFGASIADRNVRHPIYEWLDYHYRDYGAFARLTDDREIGGFRNRLVAGVNVLDGWLDNRQFANIGGAKGALKSSSLDSSTNTTAYIENSFYIVPDFAVIAGTQFLHATRDRADRFLSDGDQSGRTAFDLWSPKVGLLWQVDPTWQAFANVSRSAEVPSFGEGSAVASIDWTKIRPQRATTYEIGTRMRRADLAWEVTLYRANIRDELQCLYSSFGTCQVTNADRTYHQGIEAGAGAAVLKGLFVQGDAPDKLWLNVAYTFNDFRFDNDPVFGNNLLPGAPRHFVRAELLYKHPRGFYIGPNIEWVPQAYYVDSANTLTTQAYAIVGLKAGFDDGGPFSAYVEARNLADTAYIASASVLDRANAASPLFEPGTGRAVYAGVRYRW